MFGNPFLVHGIEFPVGSILEHDAGVAIAIADQVVFDGVGGVVEETVENIFCGAERWGFLCGERCWDWGCGCGWGCRGGGGESWKGDVGWGDGGGVECTGAGSEMEMGCFEG